MTTTTRPVLNGFGTQPETIKLYNVIGDKYFESSESEKKRFIEIAHEKALQHGCEAKDIGKMFRETHSKCPLSNVYTCFLHAAHMLWGMNFDFTVKARSAHAVTAYLVHEGKQVAVTIESV